MYQCCTVAARVVSCQRSRGKVRIMKWMERWVPWGKDHNVKPTRQWWLMMHEYGLYSCGWCQCSNIYYSTLFQACLQCSVATTWLKVGLIAGAGWIYDWLGQAKSWEQVGSRGRNSTWVTTVGQPSCGSHPCLPNSCAAAFPAPIPVVAYFHPEIHLLNPSLRLVRSKKTTSRLSMMAWSICCASFLTAPYALVSLTVIIHCLSS